MDDRGFFLVDGGVDDEEIGSEKIFERVAAEAKGDGETVKGADGFGEIGGGGCVVDGDDRALLHEPARHTDAAAEAAEAHDEDFFSGEGLWGDGVAN